MEASQETPLPENLFHLRTMAPEVEATPLWRGRYVRQTIDSSEQVFRTFLYTIRTLLDWTDSAVTQTRTVLSVFESEPPAPEQDEYFTSTFEEPISTPKRQKERTLSRFRGGIRNAGNTCYAAASVQSLCSLPAFDTYLRETWQIQPTYPFNGKDWTDSPDEFRLKTRIQNTLRSLFEIVRSKTTAAADDMKDLLKLINELLHNQFPIPTQHDADEFVTAFFDILQVPSMKIQATYRFVYPEGCSRRYLLLERQENAEKTKLHLLKQIWRQDAVLSKVNLDEELLLKYLKKILEMKEELLTKEVVLREITLKEKWNEIGGEAFTLKLKEKKVELMKCLRVIWSAIIYNREQELLFPESIAKEESLKKLQIPIPPGENNLKLSALVDHHRDARETFASELIEGAGGPLLPPNSFARCEYRLIAALDNLPQFFIVSLKRFTSDGRKIETQVQIEEELIVPIVGSDKKARYRLQSATMHSGGCGGGHYWSYGRYLHEGQQGWVDANDGSVSFTQDTASILEKMRSCYMFFYQFEGLLDS